MGITGLLPLLKDIQVKTNVSNFKGQTVGIDAYCWLHKGVYPCAQDLIMKKPTRAYVAYVMKRVRMLINAGVIPLLVFDGGRLPAKADKEAERRERRKEYREKGMAALRKENTSVAFDCFQKACDVTPEMASHVIAECAKLNVRCVVAPYEADAQLAYLMIQGITQLTISEDSDLLLYGCNKVLYKMGSDGEGTLVDLANLPKVRTVKLSQFTMEQFRWMCMLSGCDYLPSIKGMGLIKAHKMLQRHKAAKQVIKALRLDRNHFVPSEYEENFRKSEMVFKYQLVFDIQLRRCVRLRNYEENDPEVIQEDLDFAGPKIPQIKALSIALGNIDPISGKEIGNLEDFASGKVEMFQKSTSWMGTANIKAREPKFRNNKSQKCPSQETITSPDLTPPSSDSVGSQDDLSTKKKLFDTSPQACATKSLKRLSSELSEENTSSVSNWKKLYQQAGPPNKRPSYQGVFTSSSRSRKNPFTRNKIVNDDVPANTVVVSRYFSDEIEDSEPIGSENPDVPQDICSTPPSSKEEHNSPKNCQSVTKESPNCSNKMNGSFLNYLDKTDCKISGPAMVNKKKRLSLNRSPRKAPSQTKIDFTAKENCPIEKKLLGKDDSPPRKPLKPVIDEVNTSSGGDDTSRGENNIQTSDNDIDKDEFSDGKPEAFVDFEIDGQNQDDDLVINDKNEIMDKKHALFYIEDNNSSNDKIDEKPAVEVLCEDSILDEDEDEKKPNTSDCDEKPIECQVNSQIDKLNMLLQKSQTTNNSQENKPKTIKLGLSRQNCNGKGVSSFLNKNEKSQKITNMLSKFKNIPKEQSKSSSSSSNNESLDITSSHKDSPPLTLKNESLLTPAVGRSASSTSASSLSSIKDSRSISQNALSKRSKPIGLSRKKKSSTQNNLSSNDGKKQSKLSFNKFAYQKKSSLATTKSKVSTDDQGVICLD